MQVNKRYFFVKDYHCKYGTIPKGSTIEYRNELITLNWVPIEGAYYNIIKDLIRDESLKPCYTKEIGFKSVPKIIL